MGRRNRHNWARDQSLTSLSSVDLASVTCVKRLATVALVKAAQKLTRPSFKKIFKGVVLNSPYAPFEQSCGTFIIKGRQAGTSACNGDSGGPFICKIHGQPKVFGVAAWAIPTCDSFAGYSAPHNVLSWIEQTTKSLAASAGSSTSSTTTNRQPSSSHNTYNKYNTARPTQAPTYNKYNKYTTRPVYTTRPAYTTRKTYTNTYTNNNNNNNYNKYTKSHSTNSNTNTQINTQLVKTQMTQIKMQLSALQNALAQMERTIG